MINILLIFRTRVENLFIYFRFMVFFVLLLLIKDIRFFFKECSGMSL